MLASELPGAGEPRFAAPADFWGVNTSSRAESALCPGVQEEPAGGARRRHVPCGVAGRGWEPGRLQGAPPAPSHTGCAEDPLKTEKK